MNIVPILLLVILIRIRAFMVKSQILRRFWYRQVFTMWLGLIADGRLGYSAECLELEVIPVMLVKQKQLSDK